MKVEEAKIRAMVYAKELVGLREFYRRINPTHYRRTLVHYTGVIDALEKIGTSTGEAKLNSLVNVNEVTESIKFLAKFSRISKGIGPFFDSISNI